MKKRGKGILSCLVAGTMIMAIAGCGKNVSAENETPVINGVTDKMVMAGNEINLFDGVSAADKEDGDLTSKITVSAMPEFDIKNGKATPDKAGSYELTFTVTDKAGESVSEYATLTVTKTTAEETLYKTFDFTGAKKPETAWHANVSEAAEATAVLSKGAFTFDIKNPGNGDGDVQLVLNGLELKKADYAVKVWAKSTADTYCHLLAVDENATEWKTFGGAFNVRIGQQMQAHELFFSANDGDKTTIFVNLGKITPNPDNADDATPSDFAVVIDKIEVYEVSGTETKKPVYTCNFENGETAATVESGDGAVTSINMENAAKIVIDSYPATGGIWSIKANLILDGVTVEQGKKYYYSFKLNAKNAQSGECLVESLSKYDAERANFAGFNVNAGEDTVITATFTAEKTVSDPVIRLQIGNPSENVTSNELIIDDIEFGILEGDKETNKTIYSFAETMDMIKTFNGTDEDNELGVGTIYTEDGKLVYRIDQGGFTDWHNKLIVGTGEAPVVLESDSYYTIEITAKADKDVHCSFFLNPQGGWDPRVAEGMDITTTEKTFKFKTTDTFVLDMNFEMLFQFGSEATANLGDVSIDFMNISIYQEKVVN